MNGAWDEQLHAMDYLAYAYLQVAEDDKARAVLDELSGITRVEPANAKTYYAFAAIPARFALERRRWADAAGLLSRPGGPPWADALTQFARGYGAARSGDPAAADRAVTALVALREALLAVNDRYWADQVEVQRLAVAAWAARAKGEPETAVSLLRSAADLEDTAEKMPVTPGPVIPAREQLADLLLELERPAEALVEYEAALRQSPNRFGSLWGASRAAARAHDPARARAHAQALVASCADSAATRPELAEARALLAQP
jgi:tetratricopeptide (TPR) repeat protein